jgi:hypothetical protein
MSTMSWMNEDTLCGPCDYDEHLAPTFAAAKAAELGQTLAKNFAFAGAGLTDADVAFMACTLLRDYAGEVTRTHHAGRGTRGTDMPPILRAAAAIAIHDPALRAELLTLATRSRQRDVREWAITALVPDRIAERAVSPASGRRAPGR